MEKTLYEILGIKKNATQKEIKNAYREKSKENHPDKNGDPGKMAEINHANDILSDPIARIKYDKTGSQSTVSFKQRFQATMDSLLMQIVSEHLNNVDTIDVIGLIKSSMEDGLKTYKDQKEQMVNKLHKLLSVKKRTKSKDKTIQNVVDIRIDQMKKGLAVMAENIKFTQDSLEFLKIYSYEYDKPKPSQPYTITILNA